MTITPGMRTATDATSAGPPRRARRPAGGRPRRALTVVAGFTLLTGLLVAAPTAGTPTAAEAAAAVTQRLLPPKAGPDARRTCGGAGTVAVTTADLDVPKKIKDNPGATFCFAPGVYRLPTLVPTAGQTFIGTPQVILSGAVVLGKDKWRTDAATGTWYVTDQNQNPTGSVNWEGPCAIDHPMCRQPEELFFDDAVQRPVSSLAKVEPGTWFFDHAARRIYVGSNPIPEATDAKAKNPTVETSIVREAFASAAAKVTISNMVVEKYATYGHSSAIGGQYPGPGWTVSYTEVRNNHSAGIALNGGRAEYNFVHHNGEQGICGIGADNVVKGNEISFNNTAGYDFANGGGAGKFSHTSNLQYTNNYVHDNYGMGPWTDGRNVDTLFENNIVDDNDGAGIMHEISFSATIRNNLLRGNGRNWGSSNNAGIFISSSRDVKVTGNTIVVSATAGIKGGRPSGRMGITILQGQRYQQYCDGPVREAGSLEKVCVARNNQIENNTIEYTSYLHYLGGGNGYSGSGVLKDLNVTPAGNVFRGNSYLAPDCNEERWFWVDTTHNNDSYRGSFARWQAAGNDPNGSCRTL